MIDDAIKILPSYVMAGVSGYATGGGVGALTSLIAKLGLQLD